jgi:hypothetical protein
MSGSQRYYWVPGNARHDRGYTLEEALVAVGPGWAPLVEEAWRTVTPSGSSRIRALRVVDLLREGRRTHDHHSSHCGEPHGGQGG